MDLKIERVRALMEVALDLMSPCEARPETNPARDSRGHSIERIERDALRCRFFGECSECGGVFRVDETRLASLDLLAKE